MHYENLFGLFAETAGNIIEHRAPDEHVIRSLCPDSNSLGLGHLPMAAMISSTVPLIATPEQSIVTSATAS